MLLLCHIYWQDCTPLHGAGCPSDRDRAVLSETVTDSETGKP